MNRAKLGLLAVVVLMAAVAAGFLWGAWGRWDVERRLRDAELRASLAEARGALYAARVDVAELNFGQAGGGVERARKTMESLAAQFEEARRPDAAAAVREAAARAGEAQQATASADQSASARLADAIRALSRADAVAPQR